MKSDLYYNRFGTKILGSGTQVEWTFSILCPYYYYCYEPITPAPYSNLFFWNSGGRTDSCVAGDGRADSREWQESYRAR